MHPGRIFFIRALAAATLALTISAWAQTAADPGEAARQDARIGALRQQLKKDPNNPQLVFELARNLSFRNRSAEAARQFERLLTVYPDNADYLLGQGQNFLWGNQPQRAIAPLRRALKLAPRYQEVYLALGQALAAAGRPAEAREIYAQALRRFNRPKWTIDALAALDAPASAAVPAEPVSPPAPAAAEPAPAVATATPEPADSQPRVETTPGLAPSVPSENAMPRRSLELGRTRETLSTNPYAWEDSYAQYVHPFAPRTVAIGRVTASSRFGLEDTTALAAGYLPFGEKTTLFIETTVSPTHRVLPLHTLHAQLNRALADGWGIQGGWKHLTYNNTAVDVLDFTVERYFGAFRAAWTITPSRSETAGSASAQRLQLSYYYGDGNAVQLLIASGREVDKPVAVDTVIATDVRTISLFGQHALNPAWVLVYGMGYTEQGATVRKAVNAGLRFRY